MVLILWKSTASSAPQQALHYHVLTCVHLRIRIHAARATVRVPRRSRVNAIAIAMSSYSVVRHVYHGASSRRDRGLKYSSQPIAKNQATMTPKAWISTGDHDSSLCGHLRRSSYMTVPLAHRGNNCAKASLYKKMTPQLLNVKLAGSPKRKA